MDEEPREDVDDENPRLSILELLELGEVQPIDRGEKTLREWHAHLEEKILALGDGDVVGMKYMLVNTALPQIPTLPAFTTEPLEDRFILMRVGHSRDPHGLFEKYEVGEVTEEDATTADLFPHGTIQTEGQTCWRIDAVSILVPIKFSDRLKYRVLRERSSFRPVVRDPAFEGTVPLLTDALATFIPNLDDEPDTQRPEDEEE